ncbi:hypothetical protein JTB14_000622 [Gonioctena quinquepunctata]|nr:hypothetical protein JTB14_000622 [Gonioctena quinquepunctata]
MAVEEKKHSYCTQSQKQTLINLMKEKENEPLLSGKFPQTFTFQDAKSKWQNIASILNSAPGASKDWKQWKKCWQDLRSKTKKKKSEQIKYARGTGGGPPLPPKLDITDELILSTIAPTAITGDTNIRETPIDFDFTFNDRMEDQSMEYVIPDEGNEVYSKEDIIPSSTIASKKKRTVASQRLHTSAVAATTLAEISRDTLDVQKQYYEKKLQLLERQVVAIEHLVEVLKGRNILCQ